MAASDDKVIRGAQVLNIPGHDSSPADVLIRGDTIIEVGPPGLPAPDDAQLIDAADRMLMPGLVNAHTHGHGSLAKGMGDRWSLELLLNAGPWIAGNFTVDHKYLAALVNAVEMVLKGCTAAYDMYFEFPKPSNDGLEAVGRAYLDLGVRAVIAPMMADRSLYEAIPTLIENIPEPVREHAESIRLAPHTESIDACRRLAHHWPLEGSSVRLALGPTIPLHCSDEFLIGCRNLANDYGLGVQMHLAESRIQAISGLKRYGKTLTRHLNDLSFLGPKFTAAHGVWLDDDDLRCLGDSGASVAHNPGSNLRLGSGIAPARAMREHEVNIGIGTDGSSCSDNQNMFEAMRMASFVSRVVDPDHSHWLGTWEVLDMATVGSARILGLDGIIGRIAPGYKADIVFLDLCNINFVPLNNVANQIVNCEDSSAVDSVMIGGRMVLWQRRFTDFDYAKFCQDVENACEQLHSLNADTKEKMNALEEFVGVHCIGLAKEPYHVQRRLNESWA